MKTVRRQLLGALLAGMFATGAPASAAPAAGDLAGDWHGDVITPAGDLTIIVTFDENGGSLAGVMESPAQAPGQKIPLSGIVLEDDTLAFDIQAVVAHVDLRWDESSETWRGNWKQQVDMPLILKRGLPAPQPVIDGLDGRWSGQIDRNGKRLRFALNVETGERGTVATFDAIGFGARGLPIAEFERNDRVVSFHVPVIQAEYEGEIRDNGKTLAGEWRMPQQPVVPLVFMRGEVETAEARRPQMPQGDPTAYRNEEVRFPNPDASGVELAGTLSIPVGEGPFPGAVLLTGSGPQNRDEAVFGHRPFAVLADHLAKNGIAVLRFDDRGVAASSGDFQAATSADFASDANAAVRFLAQRNEVNRDAIGLVGHSEGGLIAPIAAVDNDEIGYLVLLAAPGTDMQQLSLAQRRLQGVARGTSEESLAATEPAMAKLLNIVAKAESRAAAEATLNEMLTPQMMETLKIPAARKELAIQEFTRDWLRELLAHDPKRYLSRVDVPILALNGTLDLQVPARESLAAIAAATHSNPDVEIHALAQLNHMFQTAVTGAIGEYADIEETFAPVAMKTIVEWIHRRF